jgi:AcrR family transcriptional regulator
MPRIQDPDTAAMPKRGTGSRAKGEATRNTILEAALNLAAHKGLEGLSIGVVAELTGMSKSGVFAHFGSRDELQISVIRAYHERFRTEVFVPAMREARGLPRLRNLFERWLRRVSHEMESGCLYISSAVEFDDQPGLVRDAVETMVRAWQDALDRAIRQAVALQHLRADTDAAQLLYEIHGLILALHHDTRFLRAPGAPDRARKGFERLITDHLLPAPPRSH